MFEERVQQSVLAPRATQGSANSPAEYLDIFRDVVGQIGVLGSGPDSLDRVEVRGIRWQPFDVHATGISFGQSTGGGPVDRPPIQYQNQWALQASKQALHKPLDVVGDDIVAVDGKVQPQPSALGRNGESRNSRETIASIPTIVDGRLALRSPGSSHDRLEHKAGFVNENNATAVSSRFFLSAANRVCATFR